MSATTEQQNLTPALWTVLALLALSLLINYIDRSSISTAAPLIRNEFGLSGKQLGVLFSAFSWTYTVFLIAAGWLSDRFNVNWVLAIGFAVWSVATLLTGFASGFAAFLLLRLLLGMGESVAYPCYSRIVVRHFPEQRRGFANSVIAIGMPGGLAVGTFAGALYMGEYGWRPFFIVLGLATLLWLVPWLICMPRGKEIAQPQNQISPVADEILTQPSFWGSCAGLFALNFVLYFMINWLPTYLVRGRRLAMSQVATVGFVYLIAAIISPIVGWFSDQWIDSGATPTLVRKTFMAGGLAGMAICLVWCVLVPDPKLAMVLLLLAGVGFGFSNSQTWAIAQTLAGPNASGRWTGFQNFVGNFSGIIGPVIAGIIIDRTGGFFWAFAMTAVVGILGVISWIYAVGPLEQVAWKTSSANS